MLKQGVLILEEEERRGGEEGKGRGERKERGGRKEREGREKKAETWSNVHRLILSHLRSTNVHSNVYEPGVSSLRGVPLYLKEPHRLLSWSVPEGARRRVTPP